MVVWTLAKKDLRLLLRDARAMIVLLAMPLIFILVLGVSLGEGFGKKAEDTLRISVLILDQGQHDLPAQTREAAGCFALQSGLLAGPTQPLAAACLIQANQPAWSFPYGPWSELVLKDLRQTANIRVELIESRELADELIRTRRRAAVLVLGPQFSRRAQRCSFLADGINPFFRDGVNLAELDVEVLRDPTQTTAAAIIDQVVQGSMLRVIMPWMIGRAFERIGEPAFLDLLAKQPMPLVVKTGLTVMSPSQKQQFSEGLQKSLQNLFPKYNLTAKTWAALTKDDEHTSDGAKMSPFEEEGHGLLKRGAVRYQLLVPSYLVMFAFFLVLTVGWLFVAERRQGTMKRLAAAPLARWQILAGKLLPCLVLSLFQGFFILAAGRLVFAMSWGAAPLWLIPLVAATSLAAMGLAMLVAALAKTETQVAIYGTLLVLVLAGLSGCLMGDRAMMPEQMQELSRITPHAWALDAYRELLTAPEPNLRIVAMACGVLAGFGVGFLGLAWGFLRLEA
jgi:ABC-2 type transport system permease protein